MLRYHSTVDTYVRNGTTLKIPNLQCLLSVLTPLVQLLYQVVSNSLRSGGCPAAVERSDTPSTEPLESPCLSLSGWSQLCDTVKRSHLHRHSRQSINFALLAIAFMILTLLVRAINRMGTTPMQTSTISTPY